MAALKVVLDTNAILRCVSRRSAFAIVLDKLQGTAYDLWITNEIILEYEEKITEHFSKETAELITTFLSILPNVNKTDIYFHLHLINTDEDDNKFSDCAFAGNVHYLVTDDKHFNVLKSITFPSINIIILEEFKDLLLDNEPFNLSNALKAI